MCVAFGEVGRLEERRSRQWPDVAGEDECQKKRLSFPGVFLNFDTNGTLQCLGRTGFVLLYHSKK